MIYTVRASLEQGCWRLSDGRRARLPHATGAATFNTSLGREIALNFDTAASIRVMVVDDQASFRRVARAVIAATTGFELLADAATGSEALRNADHEHPDLVLMDVHMPDMDGFEATRRLVEAHPESVVVLVSIEDLDDLADEVTACGAVAFLHKHDLGPATLRDVWANYGVGRG